MVTTKNPENEAETALLRQSQQGQGGSLGENHLAGQQEGDGERAKMAPQSSASQQEQDAMGNVIPFCRRTRDNQEKARRGR
jgi:hypothetical protein